MQKALLILLAIGMMLFVGSNAKAASDDDLMIERVRRIVEEIKTASYPELKNTEIKIKLFDSRSDYFQTRFTFDSFFFGKRLRCLLKVNRNLLANGAPDDGVRAILAHEFDHALYYRSRNRLKLLGLVRLISNSFTVRFERAADLEAITRGYGEGLKTYRHWLYGQVAAAKLPEKKRNYFSPEEIDAIELKLRSQPQLLKEWRKHPPRSLPEIEQANTGPAISTRLLWSALFLAE